MRKEGKLCLIPYVGGKYFQCEWIISHFPRHKCYVELFGGSGTVLLNKPLSEVEIYNDLDNQMYSLILAVRDASDDVFEKAYGIPYSRKYFKELQAEWKRLAKMDSLDPYDRAAKFYFLKSAVFSGGDETGGIKVSKENNEAIKYYNRCVTLFKIAERMKNAVIENLDFREAITKYDGPETLFYADPPYYGLADYYNIKFSVKDHEDLSALLKTIRGKVVVSYYDLPEVIALYPGWHVIKQDYAKGSIKTKDNNIREKATEILLLNFPPEGRLF